MRYEYRVILFIQRYAAVIGDLAGNTITPAQSVSHDSGLSHATHARHRPFYARCLSGYFHNNRLQTYLVSLGC